ncbi:hypothetical protein ABPG77_007484 [Micractinium sp. CCAP 211/92]
MLVSGASTACRALLAQGAAPAAAASLLPAATPALYTAMSKLAAHTSLFSSTTAASKAAAAEPALAEAPSTPSAAKADARPAAGTVMMHPGMARDAVLDGPSDTPTPTTAGGKLEGSYLLMHPVYSKEYLESVTPQHKPPKKLYEKVGYHAVQGLRSAFDLFTGYGADMNERKWLARFLYLESVAGVPGMVAGMLRHLRSLRTMSRDNGWIHTLLEEAENERMHLLTFMKLRNPGIVFRAAVIAGQAVMFNAYCIAYTLSPRTCHAFVGYLEEEAVKTYTRAIQDLDDGKLPKWSNMQAPDIGKFYWRLDEGATMRDLLLAVRADEHCHKHVNHTFSSLDADDTNPFSPGSVHVP